MPVDGPYSRPPIVEALLDIQVELPAGFDVPSLLIDSCARKGAGLTLRVIIPFFG